MTLDTLQSIALVLVSAALMLHLAAHLLGMYHR